MRVRFVEYQLPSGKTLTRRDKKVSSRNPKTYWIVNNNGPSPVIVDGVPLLHGRAIVTHSNPEVKGRNAKVIVGVYS